MLTFEMIIVFLGLIGMVTALVLDKMRPGMILFSVTVLFLCLDVYKRQDERKEKLQKLEEKAKRELGMLPPKEFSPEDMAAICGTTIEIITTKIATTIA